MYADDTTVSDAETNRARAATSIARLLMNNSLVNPLTSLQLVSLIQGLVLTTASKHLAFLGKLRGRHTWLFTRVQRYERATVKISVLNPILNFIEIMCTNRTNLGSLR